MNNLLEMTASELVLYLSTYSASPPVVSRVIKSIYRDGVSAIDEIIGISSSIRHILTQHAIIDVPQPLDERVSADGQTTKILFMLADSNTVETTMMLSRTSSGRKRCTICVSSQVGCAIGCPFCATGQQGFVRNLTAGEIIGQVLFFLRRYRALNEVGNVLTNVVFMGMGEPLSNYDNVCKAVNILGIPQGLGLSARQIMLSTAGLVPQIKRLAQDKIPLVLALSLHASDDELRNRLVPINRKYPIAEVLSACREYTNTTGRCIYVEYAIFAGINDSITDADALLKLLANLPCAVNLIASNPTCSLGYQSPARETVLTFQKRLIDGGLRTMLRVPRGVDIEAGCGQLRSRLLT